MRLLEFTGKRVLVEITLDSEKIISGVYLDSDKDLVLVELSSGNRMYINLKFIKSIELFEIGRYKPKNEQTVEAIEVRSKRKFLK